MILETKLCDDGKNIGKGTMFKIQHIQISIGDNLM
jgi:hypothetical protein